MAATTSLPATLRTGWADRFAVDPGYLNAATSGIPPLTAAAALREALATWETGHANAADYDAAVARSRSLYAGLVGVPEDLVAVGSQTSVFASLVAGSLPDGAEVVVVEGDFTSMTFPFMVHADRGVTVRHVPLPALADALTPRTALVAVSLVQSACGTVADLDAVLAAAARVGARTFVDVTQAAGWLPFDASRVDYSVNSGYKWLLGPRGTAFFTVRRELLDSLRPATAGWYAGEDVWSSTYGPAMNLAAGARRFDVSPAWLSWVGAVPGLELITEIGVPALHEHGTALAAAFRDGLGLPQPERPSPVVALCREGAAERLTEAGVRAAVRAGKVRLAFHLWNTIDDVDRALAALA
ncbi:MAG TPA: aminotransferase class V-fold PLP-dependent enzyme [Motilibacteraceae bacterium]|nr:aminotransferase class V-fold PLP-dependent enzyme [Motilibacteraceae bacterium]